MTLFKNQQRNILKSNSIIKILLIVLISLFCLQLTTAQNQTITVTIDNVKNDIGNVVLSLHTAETFMKSSGIQSAESKISDGKITVTFKDLTPGTYAIMAIHDENENNVMDFDASGMPNESYGMSNNPLSYGPPTFADAKFDLKEENLSLAIRF